MTQSLILSTIVKVAAPLLLLFAVVLFLQGHNAPGGGFIAGLLTGAALLLRIIAQGRERVALNGEAFTLVICAGLAIALATAIVPVFLGHAFFTHTFGHVHVPLLGEVELASAALFDLGVYVVVVGNVVTVITSIAGDD